MGKKTRQESASDSNETLNLLYSINDRLQNICDSLSPLEDIKETLDDLSHQVDEIVAALPDLRRSED